MKHARIKVSGYTIPLIGIPAEATEFECDLCHAIFNDPSELLLNPEGNQFLCCKCRSENKTKNGVDNSAPS